MSTTKRNKSSEDIAETVKQFLKEHPDVRQAIEQFGLTLDQYQRALEAQQKPVLYNGTSTM